MPNIRPISDLQKNAYEISELCHTTQEPIFITRDGIGDLVIMSVKAYQRQQALINLYIKLAEAEGGIAAGGTEGEEFFKVAKQLRSTLHGKI
jgi:PHD/YefM family antitoxin component YafN of YafNO toxin-antitoxin module